MRTFWRSLKPQDTGRDFESWKIKLVDLCDANASRLWDYSNYNEFTAEMPPAQEDKETVMQWYWESGITELHWVTKFFPRFRHRHRLSWTRQMCNDGKLGFLAGGDT